MTDPKKQLKNNWCSYAKFFTSTNKTMLNKLRKSSMLLSEILKKRK